jgi:hypothetical protein
VVPQVVGVLEEFLQIIALTQKLERLVIRRLMFGDDPTTLRQADPNAAVPQQWLAPRHAQHLGVDTQGPRGVARVVAEVVRDSVDHDVELRHVDDEQCFGIRILHLLELRHVPSVRLDRAVPGSHQRIDLEDALSVASSIFR